MASRGGRINFQVGLETDKNSFSQLKNSLKDLQNIKITDFRGTEQQLRKIQQTAMKVDQALEQAFNVNLNSLNIKEFNAQLKQSGLSVNQVYSSFSKAGTEGKVAFNRMARQVLTTNTKLKETHSILENMGTTMMNTVKWGIASSIMNNFTGSVRSAFDYVKSLEASLTDIRIVTGDSQEKMDQFAESANKAAQALGRSTMDYTKSALTFYQQGLSDEEVAARTEATLKAQNITGAGTEMADYLTSVWNGYKVANEQAELYVDKLAAVADRSASDMSQLATAMSKVASAANNVGVDVDSLNAQLATVIATTRAAPESVGTAFKTIYARINDIATGADEAQVSLGRYSEKMASLGFNVLDSNGKLRETQEVIEEIGNSWGDLSKEQQIYLAQTMAGQRQYNNLIALFDNWNSYTKLLNTSLESQGTLSEKNGRYMESLGAKMEQLGAAQERVKSALIDEDDLAGLIGALGKGVNLFGSFVESIGGGSKALLSFGSVFTTLFSGTIAKQINNVIIHFQNIFDKAAQVKAEVEATKTYAAVGAEDPDNKSLQLLTQKTQQMQKYYSLMSEEQKNTQKNILKEMDQAEESIVLWQNRRQKVEEYTSALLNSSEKGKQAIDVETESYQQLQDKLEQIEKKTIAVRDALAANKDGDYVNNLRNAATNMLSNTQGLQQSKVKEVVQALNQLGTTTDANSTKVIQLRSALIKLCNDTEGKIAEVNNVANNSGEAIEKATQKSQNLQKEFDKNNKPLSQLYDVKKATEAINGLTRFASGVINIINLTKIWNNENLSLGWKITQTVQNLLFSLPMIISGLSSIVTITASEAAQDAIAAGAKTSHAVAQYGLNAALSEGAVAALGFMGAILPYVAIFAGLSLVIYGLVKAWNKQADAAKQAAKVAQQSKKAYEQTKQSYEDLKNSITELESAEDSMQNLVKGTQQWNDALNDVNNRVLELIEKFPELGDQVENVGGKLQFKQGALEELKQKQQQNTLVSGLVYAKSKENSDQATKASLITNTSREIPGMDSSTLTKVVDTIQKHGTYLFHETDALGKLADLTDEQKKAVEDNTPQIRKLILEVNKNSAATSALKQSLINGLLKDVKEYQQSSNPQAFAKLVEQELSKTPLGSQYRKSGPIMPGNPNSGNQIDKNAVAARYAELKGQDTRVSWGKYQVKDSSGSWKQIEEKIVEDYVAYQDALEKAGDIYPKVQKDMKKIETQFGDAADIAYNFIVNGFGNIDFTQISEDDLNKLRDHISDLSGWMKMAEPQLSKNLDSLSKSIKQGWQDFFSDVELVEPVRNAIQQLKNDHGLTLDAAESIKESLSQAYKIGGAGAVNQLKDFYSTIDDWDAFNQVSSSFDFVKGDAEDFKEALNEAGVATNASTQSINAYIAAQKKQAEELSPEETYKNIHDIIDGFKDGSKTTLDQEEITALQQAGINLRDYFTLVADGTMKLKDDADGFYEHANQMSLQPFVTQLESLQQRLQYLNNFSQSSYSLEGGGNWNDFSDKASNSEDLAAQLQFLQAIGVQKAKIKQLNEKIAQGQQVSQEELKYASELVTQHKKQYFDLSGVQERLTQQAQDYAEELQNIPENAFQLDADVNAEQFENLSEYLQDYADQIEGVSEDLKGNKEDCDELASAMLRYDSALAQMLEKYDTWQAALQSGSLQEQIQTANELQNVYSDLLNLQPNDQLSQGFLTSADNLQLFKQAAEGSTQAYDELQRRAQQDILVQADIDVNNFYNTRDDIYKALQQLTHQKFDDIEIGAAIDDKNFIDALNDIIEKADMGSMEASKYLSQMGFDAQFGTDDYTTTETRKDVGWKSSVTEHSGENKVSATETQEDEDEGIFGTIKRIITKVKDIFLPWTVQSEKRVPDPVQETVHSKYPVPHLRIKSLRKSAKAAGGKVKFTHASHGAGNAGTTARKSQQTSATPPKKSSSPKKARSSTPRTTSTKKNNDSNKKKKKSTKKTKTKKEKEEEEKKEQEPDHMDQVKKESTRYHEIDITLQKINTKLTRIQKQQKKLSGSDLIKNLNKQLTVLNDQVYAYQKKIKLAKQEAEEIKKQLRSNYWVGFWSSGDIVDYSGTLETYLNRVNDAIEHYNHLNAEAQKEYKEVVDKRKQEYEEVKKLMDEYNKLRTDTIPGLEDSVTDALDSITNLNIEKFKVKIDVSLDLTEATQEWNEFKKQVIDKIRDDDIFGNVNAKIDDFFSYYGDNNLITKLTQQVASTLDQLTGMDAGLDTIYNGNREQAIEDLKKYTDTLMDNLKQVNSLIKEIKKSYYDMVNASQSAFDEQIKKYGFLEDVINHDKKLIEMLYGDQAYDKMNTYFQKQEDTNKRELDFQRQQKDFWWAQMQAQKARMASLKTESNEYKEAEDRFKELEEHWTSAVNSFNSQVQKSISNLLDKYNNSISIIFNDLNKKLTNGKGLEYIGEEWELISDQADNYFDKIDSMYELQKLRKAYSDAINENDGNLAAQQSLNNLMEQQLKMLQDKDRLSQYDIDRANLLLQIEMKRFALEQKQQSKSKLRLRRDSQGNYSYQYTSDTEEITQAQQSLAEAQSQLYDLDKTTYRKNLNDIYNIQSNFNEKMQQLYAAYPVWTEEAEAKRKLLIEKYQDSINNLVNDNQQIRLSLMDSTFQSLAYMYDTDVDNFINMSRAEQDELMNSLIPEWKSGIQEMTNVIAGKGGLVPVWQEAFESLKQNTKDYKDTLKEIQEVAQISFDEATSGSDSNIIKIENLIDANDKLIEKYSDEMKAIDNVIDQVEKLIQKYKQAEQAATFATEQAYKYWQQQQNSKASSISNKQSGVYDENKSTSTKKASNNGIPEYNDSVTFLGGEYWDWQWGGEIKGVQEAPKKVTIAKVWQGKTNYPYPILIRDGNKDLGWVKKSQIAGYDTGGYTGDWGSAGKLGVLHEKEIILNAKDTKNLLSAVNIVRTMESLLESINTNLGTSNILSNTSFNNKNGITGLDQNVYITANFPNVNSKIQIQAAFNNLINRASQYVHTSRI